MGRWAEHLYFLLNKQSAISDEALHETPQFCILEDLDVEPIQSEVANYAEQDMSCVWMTRVYQRRCNMVR